MYATKVGLPVVPDEPWNRTICSRGTARKFSGYASRRSAFVVNGILAMSSMCLILSGDIAASANAFL